jgi:hypothetical protein
MGSSWWQGSWAYYIVQVSTAAWSHLGNGLPGSLRPLERGPRGGLAAVLLDGWADPDFRTAGVVVAAGVLAACAGTAFFARPPLAGLAADAAAGFAATRAAGFAAAFVCATVSCMSSGSYGVDCMPERHDTTLAASIQQCRACAPSSAQTLHLLPREEKHLNHCPLLTHPLTAHTPHCHQCCSLLRYQSQTSCACNLLEAQKSSQKRDTRSITTKLQSMNHTIQRSS